MSSSVKCGNCGENDLEYDQSRGDTYCTKCGNVCDKNRIVTQLQFQEGNNGCASIVGQWHDSESESGSRQRTLANAKQTIHTFCDHLKLNKHFIDMAFRFYKMALHYRLTNGRKHIHVIAACVYITCRSEGTDHMLLDLSDVSNTNVYELGRTYLKLISTLCITLPAIDPSIYIIRFAQHLQLGEKNNVSVERIRNKIIWTANRLVQRMTRDWIHYGRRPSGLCGAAILVAAILVAARLNEVKCDIKDVIKIVKVCETTIRKRLFEFSETPSSKLTIDEFMAIDLESEEDPPCFKAANRKQKLAKQQLDDDIHNDMSHFQKIIDNDLEKSRKKLNNRFSKYFHIESNVSSPEELAVQQFIADDTLQTIDQALNKDTHHNYEQYIKSLKALRPTAKSLGITQTVVHNKDETLTQQTLDMDIDAENDELDLTGINDEELDAYLLNNEEINAKTNIWNSVHAEYLTDMKLKNELKEKEDEERRSKEASGDVRPKKKRKTKKKTQIAANSADEAIVKMLSEKKLSNKINYNVMKGLSPRSSDILTIKPIDHTSIKHINNTQTDAQKPILSLKRLSSLKNSSHTSLGKLKSQLYTQLKSKHCDNNVSIIKRSEPESKKTVVNSSINSSSIETIIHSVSDTSITDDRVVDEQEEEEEEELDEVEEDGDLNDYIRDYEARIDEMLCFDQSSDYGDDDYY